MTPSVLLVVSSLSAGGAERVISELANAWAAKGWRIGVLTLSGKTTDHYRLHPSVVRIGLDIVWESRGVWQSIVSNVRRSRMLRMAIAEFKPDLVLSFLDQTNVRILVATVGLHIPVLVSERIDPRRHSIGHLWNVARRLVYPQAQAVVVQTEAVAAWARTLVPARKVHVIPNFVRELPHACARRDANFVLAVGRLDRQKGFDVLLAAFASIYGRPRDTRLVILGDGPEREALQNLAARLGIAGDVDMPGVVDAPEDWMARASVFVMSSRYEGFPNALIEAMAMGCPVISTDCDSGPREIITDGVDGLLVPPEDAGELALAMTRLLEDRAQGARLGIAASHVRERYAKANVLMQWEGLVARAHLR